MFTLHFTIILLLYNATYFLLFKSGKWPLNINKATKHVSQGRQRVNITSAKFVGCDCEIFTLHSASSTGEFMSKGSSLKNVQNQI